jgi:hypothetical protein
MSHFGLEHIPIWPTMPTRPGGATGNNIIDALADVTCDLSTVNGTAFISNPSFPLDWAVNRLITLTAGGKTLTGYGKAAGTGETLDVGYLADPLFNGDVPGWEVQAGLAVTGGKLVATNAGSGTLAYQDLLNTLGGALMKLVYTISDYTDGSINFYYGADAAPDLYTARNSAGTYTEYHTRAVGSAGTWCAFAIKTAGSDLSLSQASFKQVLTPSATGITIVSTQGGATRNWASDDGIDPNSASFTLTVSF